MSSDNSKATRMGYECALQRCIEELHRQYDESRTFGLGWCDTDDPERACLDGYVNLAKLVEAILG